MSERFDWTPILVECAANALKKTRQFLGEPSGPQKNLGTGAGGDPIKQVDLDAENIIVDTLVENGVAFTLISEESGFKKFGDRPEEHYITTDPIDGTTNFTRGIPFYATSIAVSTKPTLDCLVAGLVGDLFHGTIYTAEKGKGSFRDGKIIGPSKRESLEEAVIGLDLNSYRVETLTPRLNKLVGKTKHIRHFGANALELCYVADGTTDAFVDIRGKLRATDIAAATLIIKESGGLISTPEGKPLDLRLDPKQKCEFIASGNRKIHETILKLIQ